MFFPPQTAEKTLTVTVTKKPDDDGGFHITTADVSTPEQINKVITLSSGFLVTVTVMVFSAVSLPLVALILTR
jgi:hypothetical protein